MATTKIWAIKKRLDHVIEYTTNPSKTSKEKYSELHNVIEYATASYKTEEQLYVSALNCSKENSYQDMMRVKKKWRKQDSILGFHAFQSFAEGEVTAEQAHQIGVQLAEELWGDRFQVVVSTHLNTNHIHNHFCLNSVSFIDGKKYYDNHASYALMRETSDRLCEENNLSVIKEKKTKANIDYIKFYKSQVTKSTYSETVKDDIDYAIEQAYSYNDFLSLMHKMDYIVENRSGKLGVRKTNRSRNIRIARAFGNEYEIKRINERIFETESTRVPFPEVRTINSKYRYSSRNKNKLRNKKKIKGFRALYFYYCYLLKVYPKKKQRISSHLREDIKKMDKLSNEAKFLSRTGIQTDQELLSYKSSSIKNLQDLVSKQDKLWTRKTKAKTDEEKQKIHIKIQELSQEIKKQKYEIELIEDIETRIPQIKENLKEEQKKDKIKNIDRKGQEK